MCVYECFFNKLIPKFNNYFETPGKISFSLKNGLRKMDYWLSNFPVNIKTTIVKNCIFQFFNIFVLTSA